jgi:uncharacterized membrane protein YdjX (TVP38/TMEM64 family)
MSKPTQKTACESPPQSEAELQAQKPLPKASDTGQSGTPPLTRSQVLLRAVILVFVLVLTVVLLLNRDRIAQFEHLGYPGIFLISILANATVLIPMPGVLFTSAMGAVFNPFWVALASGTGAALGELSGYLAGVGGQVWLDRSAPYQRLRRWMMRYKDWPILLLAFIPNPFFDMAGFIAGSMRMPLWKFLMLTWLGKILKMLFFAYLGTGLFSLFQ